jgi:hypothetical protein
MKSSFGVKNREQCIYDLGYILDGKVGMHQTHVVSWTTRKFLHVRRLLATADEVVEIFLSG